MKKLIALSVVLVFVVSFAGLAFGENIGYIDVTKVFKEYKDTASAEDQLKKEKDSYEKDFKDAQDQLEKATKDNKTTDEIDKLKKELEEKLEPKRKSLLTLNEQLTSKIQLEIITSVKKIAKKVGIDIVLDKQAIITGGVDLTEMVVNDLNKK